MVARQRLQNTLWIRHGGHGLGFRKLVTATVIWSISLRIASTDRRFVHIISA